MQAVRETFEHNPAMAAQLAPQASTTTVLARPLELARMRQGAAVDMEGRLSDYAVLPTEDGKNWILAPKGEHKRGIWAEQGAATLSQTAESNLAQLIRAPRAFLKDMPYQLQAATLIWAQQQRADRDDNLFRLSRVAPDGIEAWRCRAILSKSYSPIDDSFIFEVMDEVLQDYPGAKLDRWTVDDDFSRLSISLEHADLGDSQGRIGLTLSNSETGCNAVAIDAWVYRLVCLNGLVAKQEKGGYRFRHIGRKGDMAESFRSAVYGTLETARQTVVDYRDALMLPLVEPAEELRTIVKANKLSQNTLDDFMAAFNVEVSNTVAGVTNAITRHAQNVASETDRHGLEVLAGDYLASAVAAHRQAA